MSRWHIGQLFHYQWHTDSIPHDGCDTDVANGISEAPGRVERWTAWAPGYPSRYPGGHAVRMRVPEVEAGVAADA